MTGWWWKIVLMNLSKLGPSDIEQYTWKVFNCAEKFSNNIDLANHRAMLGIEIHRSIGSEEKEEKPIKYQKRSRD